MGETPLGKYNARMRKKEQEARNDPARAAEYYHAHFNEPGSEEARSVTRFSPTCRLLDYNTFAVVISPYLRTDTIEALGIAVRKIPMSVRRDYPPRIGYQWAGVVEAEGKRWGLIRMVPPKD